MLIRLASSAHLSLNSYIVCQSLGDHIPVLPYTRWPMIVTSAVALRFFVILRCLFQHYLVHIQLLPPTLVLCQLCVFCGCLLASLFHPLNSGTSKHRGMGSRLCYGRVVCGTGFNSCPPSPLGCPLFFCFSSQVAVWYGLLCWFMVHLLYITCLYIVRKMENSYSHVWAKDFVSSLQSATFLASLCVSLLLSPSYSLASLGTAHWHVASLAHTQSPL